MFKEPETYTLIREEEIRELNSTAYILRHKKSGARIFLLSNDDENKVFTIGFRTPPANSTGAAHIMEHSVLCGSRKFPLKDPFVELVKGSLNTFLNAMTYSDKTVYPVASCNDTDFQNLMDVYMDAVFHPRIRETDKIFRQEGWHYEMENPEAPLTINGVVYNEMKGVFSSPESVLDHHIQKTLYPDTPYAYESGGDPEVIPQLTYEEFLEFHSRYYHPSNSYIYLYGNMDMEEKLRWLDEEYLCEYDAMDIGSEIIPQPSFTEPVKKELSYAAEEETEDGENASYLALAMTAGSVLDRKQYVAMGILDYALLEVPGAPLKQALLDKKICKDVYGGTDNGILQPYFTVVAKNAAPEDMPLFLETVHSTLTELAEKGLNKRTLAAGMNIAEFKYREADFGQFPKGLMYGLQCFDSWLYDETDPLMHLKYEETFEWLRANMETGYFEDLIRRFLSNNPHQIQLIMNPEVGLTAKNEKLLAEKMAAKKASMSEEDIERIVRETKELKAYQEEADPPEILKLLPMLTREDIGKKITGFCNDMRHEKGGDILFHNLFTGGIGYLRILFDLDGLTAEELQYASLLRTLFGMMNTENYSYSELADEIGINCGGLNAGIGAYDSCHDFNDFTGVFEMVGKVKYDKVPELFHFIQEIILYTDLTDKKRLQELISMLAARMPVRLSSAGHSTALSRNLAVFSESARYSDVVTGLSYARFIRHLDRHFNEKADAVIEKLQQVKKKIFHPSRMLVSYTSDESGYEKVPAMLEKLSAALAEYSGDSNQPSSAFRNKACGFDLTDFRPAEKEGLITSSQVQYVARTGNFAAHGLKYTSVLKVLNVILNYDYLWMNIRVKGGAYGCMSGFGRNGESYLVSYRDPNLRESNEIYEGIPEYIRNFKADERDMTKYIIGTISELDVPQTPKMRGDRSLSAYMSGVTEEMLQKERDRILACEPEDIRALAAYIEAILEPGYLCVVGGDMKIRESKDLFDVAELLLK